MCSTASAADPSAMGEAVAGEGRNMREPVTDTIDGSGSLAMKMPAGRTDHGLRLVPERLGARETLGQAWERRRQMAA